MAVAFAPASLANHPDRQPNAAFGAIVNTVTGARWILPYRVALHYHTPGCGVADQVVFTRATGSVAMNTDIIRVDAARSKVIDVRHVKGQITSAVPVSGQVMGVRDNSLVSVSAQGKLTRLAKEDGPLYNLRPDAKGQLDFLVKTSASQASARKYVGPGKTVNLGVGPLTNLGLFSGYGGNNHLVGRFTPTSLSDLDIVTTDKPPMALSQRASVIVTDEQIPGVTASVTNPGVTISLRGRTSTRTLHVPVRANPASPAVSSQTGTSATAKVTPGATTAGGSTAPPSALADKAPLTTLAAVPTVSQCAVARLDPSTQIIQPSSKQVEWAANRAVRGLLTDTRPANWQKHGLPAYSAQSLFPVPALVGGGHIPVQVLEGVLAQESNFSQASNHALPGVAGDPLIGDYYGTVYDASGQIVSADDTKRDCGYGVGQVTQHMTIADTTWSATLKRQVATDYEVNIAAATSILAKTWNQLNSAPENIKVNDGATNKIENWYAALWAYNSGIQPASIADNPSGCLPGPSCTKAGNWGLGWTNNPAQNDYLPSRTPFLLAGYVDASKPGSWPYQEKVLGWAQHPQQDFVTGGYKYTGVVGLQLPVTYYYFCKSTLNNCSSTSSATGFCLSTDRTTCWWHSPVVWLAAGLGTLENASKYVAGAVEPTVANPYPPSCSVGASPVTGTPGMTAVPGGAVVVDDLASSSTNLAGCATVASSGTFALAYGTDAAGHPTGAIDTHQIGTGYMGHSYFTHTVDGKRTNVLATGTWTPPSTVVGWQRIWVHIPDNGAVTFQADYKINTGTQNLHRVVNQRWNKNVWFDLGSFQLSAGATVTLSNATRSDWGVGAIDLAWDAIAFTPSAKPALSYVAFGDSYQAGEGLEPYYTNADNGGGAAYTNSCHRSPQAYPALLFNGLKAIHPSNPEFHFIACSGATTSEVLSAANVGAGLEESHEVPQLDSGWLDANTTNVTIGIGGNDARFAKVLFGCVLTITACTDPTYVLNVGGTLDPAPLVTWEPQLINNSVDGRIKTVLTTIRSLAPNAKVTVVGYPHLLAPDLGDLFCPAQTIHLGNVGFFTQMGDVLNGVMAARALAAGAGFVNPVPVFSGPPEHGACTFNAVDEWINGVMISSSSGSGSANPGAGSFHPKAVGHQAIANLLIGTQG